MGTTGLNKSFCPMWLRVFRSHSERPKGSETHSFGVPSVEIVVPPLDPFKTGLRVDKDTAVEGRVKESWVYFSCVQGTEYGDISVTGRFCPGDIN